MFENRNNEQNNKYRVKTEIKIVEPLFVQTRKTIEDIAYL